MQKTNHFPKMKREQAAVYLVFALLMLRAQDADAELGLDFETSPARRSLVATRFMLATWLKSRKLVKPQGVHKKPSGPNPIGNQKPPPRHD
ncbi:hypothetical protein D8674_001146 [Pyrus ussuriensis x Pyrus communis]|uniref:Secreted protein n=1 Tax=Pyrus ussuriensis x Pyrus communis TaxID=2448454 RepID=A0A5N5F5F1_9ROSA|nr:hypothetical protein D8674_001146 [Pyrus ussuriensis x Pyrus communis]